jgi:hypothetical protein
MAGEIHAVPLRRNPCLDGRRPLESHKTGGLHVDAMRRELANEQRRRDGTPADVAVTHHEQRRRPGSTAQSLECLAPSQRME